MYNKISLHETTRFRKLRYAIMELIQYVNNDYRLKSKIDVNQYNFNNIRCYTCKGRDLDGANVSYNNSKKVGCFISSKKYQVYEIPTKRNKNLNQNGNFLALIKEVDDDVYIFTKMNINLTNANKGVGKSFREVNFTLYYKFMMKFINVYSDDITKHQQIILTDIGDNVLQNNRKVNYTDFDPSDIRGKVAYKNKGTMDIMNIETKNKNVISDNDMFGKRVSKNKKYNRNNYTNSWIY